MLICAYIFALSTFVGDPQVLLLKSASKQVYDEVALGVSDEMKFTSVDVAEEPAGTGFNAVIALGPTAAKYAAAHFTTLPTVFALVPDGVNFASTLRVPMQASALDTLRSLQTLMPKARRVGIVHSSDISAAYLSEIQQAAKALEISLELQVAEAPTDWPAALQAMREKIDALWLLPDMRIIARDSFRFVVGETNRRGIPLVVFSPELLKGGALLSVSPNLRAMGRRTARLMRAAMEGRTAAPEKAPSDVEVSLEVAGRLGVTVPAGFGQGSR